MHPNYEHLSTLLCTVIAQAMPHKADISAVAEKAAEAYAAGLKAYNKEVQRLNADQQQ